MLLEKITLEFNKMFAEPFEQTYATSLRDLVNFKFIEIKRELQALMKETEKRMECKVDDRECLSRCEKLRDMLEEVRWALGRKAD